MDQLQARLKQELSEIPGQTQVLLGSLIAFSLLDILSFQLVSISFSISRDPSPLYGDSITSWLQMILSLFSPLHGLFIALVTCYFGRSVLGFSERHSPASWMFLPSLLGKQFLINLTACAVDLIWAWLFPLGFSQFANAGFGGLLPLVCLLESQYGENQAFGSTSIPFPLPFSVSKPYHGFLSAVAFSVLGGGDVDLYCGAVIGFALAKLSHFSFPRISIFTREQEAVLTTASSEPERRSLLLAATEKRLNERINTSV